MDSQLEGNYVFSASPDQERLWFLQQFDERLGAAYNIATAFQVFGKMDRVHLQKALNYLVERHEALRTALIKVDGHLKQVISPHFMVTLACSAYPSPRDLVGDEEKASRKQAILDEINHQASLPFDLSRPGLVRVSLYQAAEEVNYLAIVMHHTIADGVSMDIFIRELFISYQAFVNLDSPNLPPLDVQYADVVDWNKHWQGTPEYEKQAQYWQKKLASPFQEMTFSHDKPQPQERRYTGATVEFRMKPDLLHAMNGLSKQMGVTHFALLMTAFALQVHYDTGQTDFLIGVPVANRFHDKMLPVIGFFANTVLVRIAINAGMKLNELINQVHTTVCEAVSFQRYPYHKIVDHLRPERHVNSNSLFQLLFGLFEMGDEAPFFSDKHVYVEQLVVDGGLSKFDFSLFFFSEKESIRGLIEYSSEIFSKERIDKIIHDFLSICQCMIASREAPIDAIGFHYDKAMNTGAALEKLEEVGSQTPAVASTATQLKIQSFWQALLTIDAEIDLNDNFFELGGNSLLVTHLVEEIHRVFGVVISIKTIFLNPTILHLSDQVDVLLSNRVAGDDHHFSQMSQTELLELESILNGDNTF